ncbi:Peroxidase [Pseudolycoriella hygida]|uniref:Peroxidase n=1 Tax=Pseudolycoriella hygida TaxID=35572 RepID=A0A9Q0MPY5_9DIPT|nr:Peroxidase [Pseudolycoriella hygida]
MIRWVVLSILIRIVFSTCPALKHAYEQAIRKSVEIGSENSRLAVVSGHDVGGFFFSQPPYSHELNEYFNRTTTLLLAEQIFVSGTKDPNTIRNLLSWNSYCLTQKQQCTTLPTNVCSQDSRFRTANGACNNRLNPKWGMANTPYGRFQPANYDDGIYEVRKSVVNGEELPAPRFITNSIRRSPFSCVPKRLANHGGVMFGQFIAHDHGMRRMFQARDGGRIRSCCTKDYSKPLSPQPFGCHAFEYSEDDPFLKEVAPDANIGCMNFVRSQMIFPNDCKLGPAAAVNLATHYLDLSPVYGSEESIIKSLRSFSSGKLKTNANNVLPETCNNPNKNCYLTGDYRGTAFFTLGCLHSIYHRLHNVIAEELRKWNPNWNDELLFQEAKRVNVAIYQNNVYTEWLRVFVGDEETKAFRPNGNEYLGHYDPTVDASSTTEFSHCAFRVYHSNLADVFHFIDANNTITKTMALDDCDNGLKLLESQYSEIVRGLVNTSAAHGSFSAKVRNQMFNNNNKYNLGIDLISTDLYIGRDLGVQPYHVYFELCTGKKVNSWEDFLHTISADGVEDLKKVYESYKDVDTYAALALETRCASYLGPVGKCIMVSQYYKTRSGKMLANCLSF